MTIQRGDFLPLLENSAGSCLRLMQLLCTRLRETHRSVEEIATLSLSARLGRLLLRLARSYGSPMGHELRLDLRLSQKDLAIWWRIAGEGQSATAAVAGERHAGVRAWLHSRLQAGRSGDRLSGKAGITKRRAGAGQSLATAGDRTGSPLVLRRGNRAGGTSRKVFSTEEAGRTSRPRSRMQIVLRAKRFEPLLRGLNVLAFLLRVKILPGLRTPQVSLTFGPNGGFKRLPCVQGGRACHSAASGG